MKFGRGESGDQECGLNRLYGHGGLIPYVDNERQAGKGTWRLGARLDLSEELQIDIGSVWRRGNTRERRT